jgi:hypothetical protein
MNVHAKVASIHPSETQANAVPTDLLNSSVCIGTGWTTRVRFPAGQDLSLLHSVQAGSGAHPPSYPGAISPGVKRPGRQAEYLLPSSAEVKNGGAIPPLPRMSTWRGD